MMAFVETEASANYVMDSPPADLSVIALHADQTKVTFGVAIIGLRIRDRNRLDAAKAHSDRPPLSPSADHR
jgi:hypothetical protein